MNINEEISTKMVAVVNDLALRFALEPDDEVVADIKMLRTGLVDEYAKMFRDAFGESEALNAEADAMVVELLKCVVIKRHDLERMGSVVSRMVH
jgi:hypothetical protein